MNNINNLLTQTITLRVTTDEKRVAKTVAAMKGKSLKRVVMDILQVEYDKLMAAEKAKGQE